jgi:hypothetical protein
MGEPAAFLRALGEEFELASAAPLSYEMGNPEEKRETLRRMTSNRLLDQKTVVVKLQEGFSLFTLPRLSSVVAHNRTSLEAGETCRDDLILAWKAVITKLLEGRGS